jgi:hypothetical protein
MKRPFFLLLTMLAALQPLSAATFTVTTANESGAGSLRQAIEAANTNAGPDNISFNIPGAGVQTIVLSSGLPAITDPVTIDGTTQPGYSGAPLIQIDGNFRAMAAGLQLLTHNSVVRGLVINNCGASSGVRADGIFVAGNNNVIAGNYLGISADGTTTRRNRGAGIHLSNAVNNVIGGTTVADRNVISGNSQFGIRIAGPAGGFQGNQILGNYIGLNPSGTAILANDYGIEITNAPANIIGSISAGNVLAGNSFANIRIIGSSAMMNHVRGNRIGTQPDGAAYPAGWDGAEDGVRIENAPGNHVGGIAAGEGNVISGNQSGVRIQGSNAIGNVVRGNLIGTDPSGTGGVTNHVGVTIAAGASYNTVGGDIAGARNVISANRTDGVQLTTGATNNFVVGNFIGTDVSGNVPLGNTQVGNLGSGVDINNAPGNFIGGTAPGERNIISGNNDAGLTIALNSARKNVVAGNFIGVSGNGAPLGNKGRGVEVLGAHQNFIGLDVAGGGNVIAHNGGTNPVFSGVWLARDFGAFGVPGTNNLVRGNTIFSNAGPGVILLTRNAVLGNSISDNGGLAIDRNGDGVTANVPNGAANFPVITNAMVGSTRYWGTLNGKPNTTYRIETFTTATPDPSGHGEMDDLLEAFRITTDASGFATISREVGATTPSGYFISATATEVLDDEFGETFGETSEAAMCRVVNGPPARPDLATGVQGSSNVVAGAVTEVNVCVTNNSIVAATNWTMLVGIPAGWKVSELPAGFTKEAFALKRRELQLGPGEVICLVLKLVPAITESVMPAYVEAVAFLQDDQFQDDNTAARRFEVTAPEIVYDWDGELFTVESPVSNEVATIYYTTDLTPPLHWMPVPFSVFESNDPPRLEFPLLFPPAMFGSNAFFRLGPAIPMQPMVEVAQVGIDNGVIDEANTGTGAAVLTFAPTTELTFFNFTWSNSWVIQNIPVLAANGTGAAHSIVFHFPLSVSNAPVMFGKGGFTVSTTPVTNPPAGSNDFIVARYEQYFRSGISNVPLAYTPAQPLVGFTNRSVPTPQITYAFTKPNFPNIEQGVNECAPVAVLNSLWYLRRNGLNIPGSALMLDKIKEAVGWDSDGAPGGRGAGSWPDLKKQYMQEHGLPVNTDTTTNVLIAMNAVKLCYDVEIHIRGHVACVRGITDLGNGKYAIQISHDAQQGQRGGTQMETWTYDAATGTVTGSTWSTQFVEFVIEFP